MKKTLLLLACLSIAIISNAQLSVSSNGKVKIGSNPNSSGALLQVGNPYYNSSNVGIICSPTTMSGKNNIGIAGCISTHSNFSNDKNYGVLGVVDSVNVSHGRNYGVCGMIGPIGQNVYGGAGVYATNYTYYFASPTNIQGSYAAYFNGPVNIRGNFTSSNIFIPTDSRLNENVVSLNNSRDGGSNTLNNILGMNVIEYNVKSRLIEEMSEVSNQDNDEEMRNTYESLKKEEAKMCSRRHYGIDAEELQNIYPDLVLVGQDGYLSVNYVELVPLLIRSIQELKAEVDELKGENDAMKARSTALEDNETTGIGDATSIPAAASLAQNTPNPFSERTTIRFTLPENVQNSYICIFNMNGKLQKKIPVNSSMDSIIISSYELSPGMYLYSLIIGGQELDTKKMIIS